MPGADKVLTQNFALNYKGVMRKGLSQNFVSTRHDKRFRKFIRFSATFNAIKGPEIMKKIVFVLVVILSSVFIFAGPSNNKSYIEIFGAYDQITMSDYNTLMQEMSDIYNYFGIDAEFNRMDTAVLTEFSYVYNLESLNAGTWGIYFRGGRLNAGNESKLFYDDGTVFEKIVSDYSVFYGGFGLRKYIASFYLGADACVYLNSGNKETDNIFYSDGSTYGTFVKTWDTALYGFNFEAGMDLWFSEKFGVSFRGGYRYAKGSININWGEMYGNEITTENVDYSGMYIGAGLMLALGGEEEQRQPVRQEW